MTTSSVTWRADARRRSRTGQDRIGMPRPYVSYIRNGEVIDIIVESYVEMCNKDVQ